MSLEIIKQAITNRNIIRFYYDDKQRIVEPYLIGNTSTGKQSLRAYQIGGYSNSKIPAWKIFTVMNMYDVVLTDDSFSRRPDYNPNDRGMMSILYRVE
ncbi:WYL domain-containing protein [Methanosarcina sp.]|uniref:WYL domain-containing protein n=1 Tax=Methanosarcina sp. TaxID=2213 RepID=UPI0029881DFD|nr:WYL domain-containing protein [Methanosarcina sp.]MDW5549924.1 hypothetical protein [Methanosarcina sp.]MDW5552528.1 hypothetical protein [Methanosarcina sp.]MDW5560258.1 hypothetical protein [Methanosarcina sp.]